MPCQMFCQSPEFAFTHMTIFSSCIFFSVFLNIFFIFFLFSFTPGVFTWQIFTNVLPSNTLLQMMGQRAGMHASSRSAINAGCGSVEYNAYPDEGPKIRVQEHQFSRHFFMQCPSQCVCKNVCMQNNSEYFLLNSCTHTPA